MFSCLHSSLKTSAKFVRILEQVKTFDCVLDFHLSALEFSQTFASFIIRCIYEGMENMFYFLIYELVDNSILFILSLKFAFVFIAVVLSPFVGQLLKTVDCPTTLCAYQQLRVASATQL